MDNSSNYIQELLKKMVGANASDLFITVNFPPAFKVDGKIVPVSKVNLSIEQVRHLVTGIMNSKQQKEFHDTKECNFAVAYDGIGRFRVNCFVQQSHWGMVFRTIKTEIPKVEDLLLPETLKEIVMAKRGMILVVGATGSGKSTSLAAMIGHRNANSQGHIITVEDPIEYVHDHNKSLITQREVGVDTDSWGSALKNTLRQAPDVILIGEIRDRETMEYAVAFSETGHLCLATLHANSANQALERIINFFPEERKQQVLMDLSLNLKSVISQRLIPKKGGGRIAAVEIMLNTPFISDLIYKGAVSDIKDVMTKSKDQGMQTFDQALFDLYQKNIISLDDALRNADSMNDLRLKIKLASGGVSNIGSLDGVAISK